MQDKFPEEHNLPGKIDTHTVLLQTIDTSPCNAANPTQTHVTAKYTLKNSWIQHLHEFGEWLHFESVNPAFYMLNPAF